MNMIKKLQLILPSSRRQRRIRKATVTNHVKSARWMKPIGMQKKIRLFWFCLSLLDLERRAAQKFVSPLICRSSSVQSVSTNKIALRETSCVSPDVGNRAWQLSPNLLERWPLRAGSECGQLTKAPDCSSNILSTSG